MLTSLTAEQILLFHNDFAQSITGNPYYNMSLVMLIGCAMNKSSKIKFGSLSILENVKQDLFT